MASWEAFPVVKDTSNPSDSWDSFPKVEEEPMIDISDTLKAAGQAIGGITTTAPHAFRQLYSGLENPWQRSEGYKESQAGLDKYQQELEAANQAAVKSGDISTSSRGMRQAGQSLGFSAGAMGASLAGGSTAGMAGRYIGGLAGPEGAIAGEAGGRVIGALGASYGAAYRMAGAQFLDDASKEIDAKFMEKLGRLPNEQEQKEAYDELLPLAQAFGHAEAGPEAIGNLAMAKAGKFILGLGIKNIKGLAAGALAKVGAGAGGLATELGGETVTQVEQNRIEEQKNAMLSGQAPPEQGGRTLGEYQTALGEVAPATLATMGLIGSVPTAYKAGELAIKAYKQPANAAAAELLHAASVSSDDTELTNKATEEQIQASVDATVVGLGEQDAEEAAAFAENLRRTQEEGEAADVQSAQMRAQEEEATQAQAAAERKAQFEGLSQNEPAITALGGAIPAVGREEAASIQPEQQLPDSLGVLEDAQLAANESTSPEGLVGESEGVNAPLNPSDKQIEAPRAAERGQVVFERPDGVRYALLDNSKTPPEWQNAEGRRVMLKGFGTRRGNSFLLQPQSKNATLSDKTPVGDAVYHLKEEGSGRSVGNMSATELSQGGWKFVEDSPTSENSSEVQSPQSEGILRNRAQIANAAALNSGQISPTPIPSVFPQAQPTVAEQPVERRYTVANVKTGKIVSRPDEPMTHKEAVTFRSKFSQPNNFTLVDVTNKQPIAQEAQSQEEVARIGSDLDALPLRGRALGQAANADAISNIGSRIVASGNPELIERALTGFDDALGFIKGKTEGAQKVKAALTQQVANLRQAQISPAPTGIATTGQPMSGGSGKTDVNIPQEGDAYDVLRFLNKGKNVPFITRKPKPNERYKQFNGPLDVASAKPQKVTSVTASNSQTIQPPITDSTMRTVVGITHDGEITSLDMGSERETGGLINISMPIELDGLGDKYRKFVVVDNSYAGRGQRDISVTEYTPKPTAPKQISPAAQKEPPLTPSGQVANEGGGPVTSNETEVGGRSNTPVATKETPQGEVSSGKVEAGNAAKAPAFNEKAALYNDLVRSDAEYRSAEKAADEASRDFLDEREKVDVRKRPALNYTYKGPRIHQERLMNLAQKAAQARQTANAIAKENGNLRRAYQELENKESELSPDTAVNQKTEQPASQKLIDMAKRFGGRIAWADGDMGIIEAFQLFGSKSLYVAIVGDRYSTTDFTLLKPNNRKDLLGENEELFTRKREELIQANEKRLAENPDGPFTNGRALVVSKSVPDKVASVFKEWSKMLGLNVPTRIVLTTFNDGIEMAAGYGGKFRRIGSTATKQEGEKGVSVPLGDNDFHIAYQDDISFARILEVIAHELGHVLEKQAFKNLPQDQREAIMLEHEKWLKRVGPMKAIDGIRELRSMRVGKIHPGTDIERFDELTAYWKSFSEWFADQVAKWSTTTAKPLSVVEKFFARLGKKLREFFFSSKHRFAPNQKVADWLNSLSPDFQTGEISEPLEEAVSANDDTRENPTVESIESKALEILLQKRPNLSATVAAKAKKYFASRNSKDLEGVSTGLKTAINHSLQEADPQELYAQLAKDKAEAARMQKMEEDDRKADEEMAKRQAKLTESRRGAWDSVVGTPTGVEMNAVSEADGQESLALVNNSGDVPGVLNAFVGTSSQFLANPENETNFPDLWKILSAGRVDEGNFAYGRAFVFTDGIGVNASDRRNAERLGITPSVAAVRRVLIHEGLVHRGIYGLPANLQMQILQWMRQNASPQELDSLAIDYPQYADWATNPQQMLGLCEEHLAKKVEKITKFPKDGPLARLFDILKDIWRWITGETGEPTVQNLRDVVKLLKAGVVAADARLVNGGKVDIKASYAGPNAEIPSFMRDALDAAKAMSAAGKTSEEIRSVTGWFPGKYDGKMRWEIPDSGSNVGLSSNWDRAGRLGGLLVHPELFKAYPDLKNIEVLHRNLPDAVKATYTIDRDYITINENLSNRRDVLSSILHEVQHAIQKREGFARGSSPDEAFLRSNILTANKKSAYKDYINTAGEIESRDVQNRQNFTPEILKSTEPYSSENIAKEDAIVLYGGGVSQSSRPAFANPINAELARAAERMRAMGEKQVPQEAATSLDDVKRIVNASLSRAEVETLLKELNTDEVKDVVRSIGYPTTGTKADNIKRILSFVGSRADAIAIRGENPTIRNSPTIVRTPEQQAAFDEERRLENERARELDISIPKKKPTYDQEEWNRNMAAIMAPSSVPPAQIRSEIRAAYDRAIQGSGSVQAPIQQVFDEAKTQIPTLTEKQFGEQLQALYEDGSAFLVPADRSDTMLAAGEKWGVYDASGMPASYVGIMPSEVKASVARRPNINVPNEIKEQARILGKEGDMALNRHRALKALQEAQPKFHIKQDAEAIVAVAINIVDALKSAGVTPQELNGLLTDPEFLDDLGIPIDSSLYQAVAMEMYRSQQDEVSRLEKEGKTAAANKLRQYVSAMQKQWYESGTRGGKRQNVRLQLINNPRYQGLFLATHLNESMREAAQAKVEAQTDIKAEDIEGADKKSTDAANKKTADEFADLEMDELYRLGEEQLDAEEKSLWVRIKDYIADLAAIALANLEAAKNNIRASNVAMSASDRVKKFIAMSQEDRDNTAAEIHKKLKADMKKFMGEGTETKKKTKQILVDGEIDILENPGKEPRSKRAPKAETAEQKAKLEKAKKDKANATAARLIYRTEELFRQGFKNDVRSGQDKPSIYKEFIQQIQEPTDLDSFAARLAKLKVSREVAERMFRTAALEKTDREAVSNERNRIRLQELREKQAMQLVYLTEQNLRQSGIKGIQDRTASENDSVRKAFKDQINAGKEDAELEKPLTEEEFVKRLAALKVRPEVAKIMFKTAERERADIEASNKFDLLESPRALRNMMRKLAELRMADKTPFLKPVSWKKLFSLSKGTQEQRRAEMEAAIRADESLQNISEEDQKKLADLIEAAWNFQREKVFKTEIDRLTRLKKTSEKAKKAITDSTEKLLEMVNQGVLDNDELYALIAEKFGFKPLTQEQKAEIEDIAQKLQEDLPPYRRTQLVSKFKDIITKTADVPFAQKAADWWVTAVLTGPRTAFTIGLGFLSGGYQVLSNAIVTVARHSGDINAWRVAGASINDWVASMPRNARNALGYLWDGREDRLDPTMSNISSWLNLDKKSLTQTDTASVLLNSKNPISRLAGGFMTFFKRLLVALDMFNAASAKDGSLAMSYYQTRQSQDAPFSLKELSSLRDFKAARDYVLGTEFGGVEPTNPVQKSLLDAWASQYMWQQIAKFEGIVENATYNAQQGAMSLDPSGLGGHLYHAILKTQANQKELSESFMQSSKKALLRADGITEKSVAYNRMLLAYIWHFAAYNMLGAVGLKFARYAGNRLNQTISFVPVLGAFRLHETEGVPREMHRSQIIANQAMGSLVTIIALALMKEMADEPDEERRGWGWEGSWDTLTPERKSQRMSAGKQAYTLTIGGKTFKYNNWPMGGVMAAVGSLMDMIQYSPDKWNERTIPGKVASAGLAALLSVGDSASLSQFSEMFGRSVQTRDPLDAVGNTLSKTAANYAGGFIPRIFKDVDKMFVNPEINRYKTPFEFMAREVPIYRSSVGKPMLDIFAKPVAPAAGPTSREFIEQPTEPEYRQIGRLNERGIWLTNANPENRLVGKGSKKRHMTDEEGLRYIKATGQAYKEFVLRNTDKILSMTPERGKQFVLDKADEIRDRAAKQSIKR